MQLRAYLPYIFFFLLLVSIAFSLTYNFLDPDFGWHVKSGELILERGVPYQDWYSFSMPTFGWVNHEWLMDVFMYWIYGAIGIQGLLLVFLAFYTASFFIISKSKNFWVFALPVALGFLATTEFLGIRPQLFTVFFVAILLWLVDAFLEKNSKLIYALPLLFLAWVNVHASFFAGLFILCAIVSCEIFKKFMPQMAQTRFLSFLKHFYVKEQPAGKILWLSAITAICFLITLINPYGIRIYEELFRTIGDSYLKFHITEWFPLFLMGFKPLIYLYLAIFISSALLFYRKIEFSRLILSVAFLLLSFSSIRYFLIFVIVSLPILISLLEGANIDAQKVRNSFTSAPISYKFLFSLPVLVVMVCIGLYGYTTIPAVFAGPSKNFYPEKAIPFLQTLPLSQNMLNDYTWGGYLIWKMPERKVFIDGRMPSWRLPADEAGQDGQFAFGDYFNMMEAKEGFEKTMEKYDIKLVLLPVSAKQNNQSDLLYINNIRSSKIRLFFEKHQVLGQMLGIYYEKNSFYEKLISQGWKIIYEDETAMVLQKP